MAKQRATLQREQKIIDLFKKNAYSIKGLEGPTGLKYYTIRAIVDDLLQRNIIKVHSTVDRHKMYVFNADGISDHDHLPRLVHLLTKQTTKMIYLLEGVGDEDNMKGVQAARRLPKHITELLRLANLAHHGADVTFMLNQERDSLQEDFLYLKNFTHLYEQLLSEPRLWNVKSLKQMPDDPDYDFVEVQKAIDYYADE